MRTNQHRVRLVWKPFSKIRGDSAVTNAPYVQRPQGPVQLTSHGIPSLMNSALPSQYRSSSPGRLMLYHTFANSNTDKTVNEFVLKFIVHVRRPTINFLVKEVYGTFCSEFSKDAIFISPSKSITHG